MHRAAGPLMHLACLPIPPVTDGPSPLPPFIPRGGGVHKDREAVAVSGQPKGRPLTRFPDGRHRVLPPGPPPTGHGALPLQASGEEPAGQGLRIRHGGPSLARMQGGVVRVLHPGGEEALPLRGPRPQDAAPRRPSPPRKAAAPSDHSTPFASPVKPPRQAAIGQPPKATGTSRNSHRSGLFHRPPPPPVRPATSDRPSGPQTAAPKPSMRFPCHPTPVNLPAGGDAAGSKEPMRWLPSSPPRSSNAPSKETPWPIRGERVPKTPSPASPVIGHGDPALAREWRWMR